MCLNLANISEYTVETLELFKADAEEYIAIDGNQYGDEDERDAIERELKRRAEAGEMA